MITLRTKLKVTHEFMKNLIEYTQLCLLISLQINNIKEKEELLKLNDQLYWIINHKRIWSI